MLAIGVVMMPELPPPGLGVRTDLCGTGAEVFIGGSLLLGPAGLFVAAPAFGFVFWFDGRGGIFPSDPIWTGFPIFWPTCDPGVTTSKSKMMTTLFDWPAT